MIYNNIWIPSLWDRFGLKRKLHQRKKAIPMYIHIPIGVSYIDARPGHSFIRCVKSQKFKIISSYQHIFLLFQFLYVGNITSIEHNHKQVETARKGQEVCIKIEAVPGESPKMYGRHFEETDMLVSKVNFNNNNNTQCIFTYCRKSWSQYFFNRPFMIFFKL